jgi:hypothetical protein
MKIGVYLFDNGSTDETASFEGQYPQADNFKYVGT